MTDELELPAEPHCAACLALDVLSPEELLAHLNAISALPFVEEPQP